MWDSTHLPPNYINLVFHWTLIFWSQPKVHWKSIHHFWWRPLCDCCFGTGEEERAEHLHHMQQAQTFFPSCICAAVLPIIHLLADGDVGGDGVSVNEVAEKVIWNCMVEDPVLFLRHFLEKLTHRDKLVKKKKRTCCHQLSLSQFSASDLSFFIPQNYAQVIKEIEVQDALRNFIMLVMADLGSVPCKKKFFFEWF